MTFPNPLRLLSLVLALRVAVINAQNLTEDQISLVKDRLSDGSKMSWELGTRAQALIEYDSPSYSVLNLTAKLPPPSNNPPSSLNEIFNISKTVVANRGNVNGHNVTGAQPLIKDGSAADPASIGFAVLLSNWTGMGEIDALDYGGAARDQLNFLMTQVPRTSDGAISHRVSEVQLWSDFVYMVPPFLAYYGVLSNNQSLLEESYHQIRLYRQYLGDGDANGIWKHIVMGTEIHEDFGHWSTGNGWAAAGMLRVQGTIENSHFAGKMKNEVKDLRNWVTEILNGMYPLLNSNGLFTNYADNSTTFFDAASTALLASAVYRHALINNVHTHLPDAERCRMILSSPFNSSSPPSPSSSSSPPSPSSPLQHFDSDMWLTPVVNPHSFGQEGSQSPEAQAFVVEMQAAWKDWVLAGSPGASDAGRGTRPNGKVWMGFGVLAVLMGVYGV